MNFIPDNPLIFFIIYAVIFYADKILIITEKKSGMPVISLFLIKTKYKGLTQIR